VDSEAAAAFALGAMMNACLCPGHDGEEVRRAIVNSGGVDALVPLLGGGAGGQSSAGGGTPRDAVVRVRAAGLLGRVATLPEASAALRDDPAKHGALSAAIGASCKAEAQAAAASANPAAAAADWATWVLEEREHRVRVAASDRSSPPEAPTGGGSGGGGGGGGGGPPPGHPEHAAFEARQRAASSAAAAAGKASVGLVVQAWHATGSLAALASFLPPAACDRHTGLVTAESVIQSPPGAKHLSARLAGNAVKCFVVVMDDVEGVAAQRLLDHANPLPNSTYPGGSGNNGPNGKGKGSNGGMLLERLVSVLANVQDPSVRKNAAIVLAKAMRSETAKQRVRELRGIEMLMALGPKLEKGLK
jgi:hypothetical protein